MLDIAYLALMLACMAGCVGVIDWLARSETPGTAHSALAPITPETDR